MQSRNTSIASSGSRGFAAIIAAGANGGSKVPARWALATEKRATLVCAVLRLDAVVFQLHAQALEGVADVGRIPRKGREDRGTDQPVDLVQAAPVRVVMEHLEGRDEQGRIDRPLREDHRREAEVHVREGELQRGFLRVPRLLVPEEPALDRDRKSTRLNSSH